MNIKEKIKRNGLRQWQVAKIMKISEFTLSRYLREPEDANRELIIEIEKAIEILKRR